MNRPSSPAAELHSVFSKNLRLLCSGEESVSQVCRTIGVNRTQFSRYLSGESFPRPELLQKICDYFGVDANILIRPLEMGNEGNALALAFAGVVAQVGSRDCSVPHSLLPSGVYRFWRTSFMWPEAVFTCLFRISRDGALTRWKSYEPGAMNYMHAGTHPTPARRNRSHPVHFMRHEAFGFCLTDTACFLGIEPDNRMLRLTTMEPSFDRNLSSYTGYTCLTRSLATTASAVVPFVCEKLEGSIADLQAQNRRPNYLSTDQLPGMLRRYLSKPALT